MALVVPKTLPPIPENAVLSDIVVTTRPLYRNGELLDVPTAYITAHISSPDPLLTYNIGGDSEIHPVQIEYCLLYLGAKIPGFVGEQNGMGYGAAITPDGVLTLYGDVYDPANNPTIVDVGMFIVENGEKSLYKMTTFTIGANREITSPLNNPDI